MSRMNRRLFLKGLGCSLITPQLLAAEPIIYSGWINHPLHKETLPLLSDKAPHLAGSGKGQVTLLYQYLRRVIGNLTPAHQRTDDCVGQAYASAINILTATRIHKGFGERWEAKASPEAIYGGSRVQIAVDRYNVKGLLKSGGSRGEWAVEWLGDYGTIYSKKYDRYDLRTYSPEVSDEWGVDGVPDELLAIAKQHPIKDAGKVLSYENVRDSVHNGYPTIICSSQGFNTCRRHNVSGRDADGFLVPCGTWNHAMVAIGMDDTKRPGICLWNSWGPNWVKGPKRHEQPDGSFWVDAEYIDKMCRWTGGDSYAINDMVGFPIQKLDYLLF